MGQTALGRAQTACPLLSQPQPPRTRAAGDEHTILRDGVAHRHNNVMTFSTSTAPSSCLTHCPACRAHSVGAAECARQVGQCVRQELGAWRATESFSRANAAATHDGQGHGARVTRARASCQIHGGSMYRGVPVDVTHFSADHLLATALVLAYKTR